MSNPLQEKVIICMIMASAICHIACILIFLNSLNSLFPVSAIMVVVAVAREGDPPFKFPDCSHFCSLNDSHPKCASCWQKDGLHVCSHDKCAWCEEWPVAFGTPKKRHRNWAVQLGGLNALIQVIRRHGLGELCGYSCLWAWIIFSSSGGRGASILMMGWGIITRVPARPPHKNPCHSALDICKLTDGWKSHASHAYVYTHMKTEEIFTQQKNCLGRSKEALIMPHSQDMYTSYKPGNIVVYLHLLLTIPHSYLTGVTSASCIDSCEIWMCRLCDVSMIRKTGEDNEGRK